MEKQQKRLKLCLAASIALSCLGFGAAQAQVTIGITEPLTGPAAVLGTGSADALQLAPTQVNGVTIKFIVLDDATDTTRAVTNVKQLIDQDHADAIIGGTTAQACLAELDVVAAGGTPTLCDTSSPARSRRWMRSASGCSPSPPITTSWPARFLTT